MKEIPTRGWIEAPSPITPLPAWAARLGLRGLWVKRDDQLEALGGGAKIRKLNTLLAAPRLAGPGPLRSVGAIGSGHLVSLCRAAKALGRPFEAHVFWEPPSPTVLTHLAEIVAGATRLRFYEGRGGLLWHPPALLGGVPPGASALEGLLGLVLAARELKAQIDAGVLPAPDVIYTPLGTGGLAAGLAVGLAAVGLRRARIRAVAVVERALSPDWLLARRVERLARHIGLQGPAAKVEIDRSQLGAGYGIATLAATEALHHMPQLPLEALYSGKAMAALMAAPPRGQRVLFWLTPGRRSAEVPSWRALEGRLPRRLEARLARWR
ncbi:pyridoxal-phosphate dependent enzyme [Myxococcota bacterium]|nr:pyridoxal-phosphate dependent enzyme [Myxococcota bacterium]